MRSFLGKLPFLKVAFFVFILVPSYGFSQGRGHVPHQTARLPQVQPVQTMEVQPGGVKEASMELKMPADVILGDGDVIPSPNCKPCKKKCNRFGCDVDWILNGRVLLMRRDLSDQQLLLDNSGAATTLLNANDFDFGYNWGIDISAARGLCDGVGMQVRFVGIESFDDSLQRDSTGSVVIALQAGRDVGGTTTITTYNSAFYSTEVNFLYEHRRGLTWNAGVRYINLTDNMDFSHVQNQQAAFSLESDNDNYGLQIGVSGIIGQRGRLRVDGFANGGLFANFAKATFNSGTALIANNFTVEGLWDEAVNIAPFVEFGIFGAYELSPNRTITCGYQAMLLSGMSTSSSQLAHVRDNTFGQVQTGITAVTDDNVWMQGFSFGFDARY